MKFYQIIFFMFFLINSFLKGVGTQFLNVPSTVNELIYSSQNAMAYFPENVLDKTVLSVSHNDWFGDFSVIGVGLTGPILGGQGLLRVKHGGFDNMELRGETPTDNPISYYSAFGTTISGGFISDFKGLKVSSLFDVSQFRIHTYSTSGFSGSLSLLKPLYKNWEIGLGLSHFGYMNAFTLEKPSLPFSSNIIITKKTRFKDIKNKFYFSGGLAHNSNSYTIIVNNTVIWRNLSVAFSSQLLDQSSQMSGGFSILLGLYKFSYGFRIADKQLGVPQVVEFSIILP